MSGWVLVLVLALGSVDLWLVWCLSKSHWLFPFDFYPPRHRHGHRLRHSTFLYSSPSDSTLHFLFFTGSPVKPFSRSISAGLFVAFETSTSPAPGGDLRAKPTRTRNGSSRLVVLSHFVCPIMQFFSAMMTSRTLLTLELIGIYLNRTMSLYRGGKSQHPQERRTKTALNIVCVC